MSKKIKQVSGDETCPCGSGKTYSACCLKGQVRYFRDGTGKVVKYNLDCLPESDPTASDDSAPEENCDHDCEQCDRHKDSLVVGAVIDRDGDLITMFDASDLSPSNLKLVIAHIARVHAKLIKALVEPGDHDDECLKEEEVPLMLVTKDEDEDLIFGGANKLSGLSYETIEKTITILEKLRIELLITLFRTGLDVGFGFLSDGDDDDDDGDVE